MRKYIIHFVNQVIKRGESNYFTPIEDLVPVGYKYTWAFSSPEILIINVTSHFVTRKKEVKKPKQIANINTWERDKYDPYRMAM